MTMAPKNNAMESSESQLPKLSLKDALYLAVFVGTCAISWGVSLKGDEARDREVAALQVRVDKNEDALNRLINDVSKVSRDTEWIREYLKSNHNRP
jgi:hypothetical protein